MSEAPQVTDGELGWDAETVSKADVSDLEPHPKNTDIYGEEDLEDSFVNSVREKGVLEPLVITRENRIISGHRRHKAAKRVGVETVPVRYSEFDDELAEREALIEFNRQREKTPGQITNEFEEILEIEQERAQKRKKHQEPEHPETFPDAQGSDKGDARDKAAEKVNAGVSGRTLEKGLKVKEKAESGDDVAKGEWEKLREGKTSFHRAHKNVEKKEAEEETERQRTEPDETPARITESDAIEFIDDFEDGEIDLLLTDPPYSSDVDNIHEFAESWVPAALEKVASDGHAYICIGEYPHEIAAYYDIVSEFDKFDEVQLLAWTYRNTLGRMPNRRYGRGWQAILYLCGEDADDLDVPETKEQFSAMDINAPDGRHGTKHHKWQKPAELFERFVRHSTDEDDLVVDPFAGSGTTLLEAAKLGRSNRGCDADPEAIEAALERGCVSDA